MSTDLHNAVKRWADENATRIEGRSGLVTLAKLARALGYKDPNYWGQLDSDAAIGDITNFFEDNSGAVQAVIDWVGTQRNPEWEEGLRAKVETEEDQDWGTD